MPSSLILISLPQYSMSAFPVHWPKSNVSLIVLRMFRAFPVLHVVASDQIVHMHTDNQDRPNEAGDTVVEHEYRAIQRQLLRAESAEEVAKTSPPNARTIR